MSSVAKSTKVYSGFAPTQIPGCKIWLDAADINTITASGSNVSAWRDKASSLTFSNSGTVTYTASSKTMNFTGSNVLTNATGVSTSVGVNQFVVWSSPVGATRQRIFQQTYTGQYAFGIIDTNFMQNLYSASLGYYVGPLTYSASTTYLYSVNTRSGTGLTYSVNGVESSAWTSAYTPGVQSTNLFVGGGGTFPFTGSVMEVLHYDAFLTVAQTQQIEGYLAQKWGLASVMPATHPFGLSIAPSPQSFSPRDIDGCALWLDAGDPSSLTLSGSNVSAWRDKSGAGYAAVNNGTNTTARSQVSNINGVNVVSFPTLSQLNISNMSIANQNKSIFYVIRVNGTLSSLTYADRFVMPLNCLTLYGLQVYISGYGTAPPYNFNCLSIAGISDCVNFTTNTNIANTPILLSAVTVSGSNVAALNGTTQTLTANNAPGSFLTAAATYTIGNAIYTTPWDLGEMIIYNTALSPSQRQQVEGYLAWKWGVIPSIPSPHPYKLALPYVRQFSPRDIAGCALWLDAADTSVFNGGSTWTDKSGTGNHAVNGTPGASAMPTVTTWSTGTNAARFVTASKNSMKTTNNIPNLNVTYFVVARMNDVTALGRIMINNVDGQRQINATANFPSTVFGYGSGSAAQVNILSVSQSQAFQVCLTVASGSTGFIGYGNGTLGGNTNTSTSSPSKHYFGSADSDGGYMSGDIAEILIYNTVLSTAQRQQVEGYLAWKWNLTSNLPAAHPFEDKPPYAQPFLPTNIAGCSMWLDAADTGSVVLSGSNVTQWSDKSGNGRNAVVSSTAFATYSNSGLYFANSLYTTTLSASPTNETLFLVFNNTSSSNTGAIIGAYGGGREIANYDSNRTVGIVKAQIAWGPYANFPAFNAKYMAACIVSPTATKVIVNGGTSITTGSAITFSSISNTILGREAGVDFGVTGIMHEVISFNSVLSDTQRQQIEGYLAWKWGLTSFLSVGHPFKYSAPSYYIPPFTPTDLVGCALWLDAADSTSLTLSGSNVSAWRDKSPSSLDLTLTGTPTWTANSVNFTGTQYFTNSTISLNLSTMTVFLVGYTLSGSQNGGFMSFVPIPNGTDYNQSNAIAYTIDTFTAGTLATTFNYGVSSLTRTYTSPTNPFLFTHVQSGTAMTLYGLGTSFYTTTTNFTPGTTTGLTIGARYQTGNGVVTAYLTGNVKEIIVYNTALTTTQRQMVENYLAWKWGLNQSLVVRPNVRPLPLYARPINPLDIVGCALWLDAADATSLTLSGSNVTQWRDKSGNTRDVAQANSSLQPVLSDNGIYFPTISNTISNSLSTGLSDAFTAYIVFTPTASTTYSRALNLASGNNRYILFDNTQVNLQNSTAGQYQTWAASLYSNTRVMIGANISASVTAQYGVNGASFTNMGSNYFSAANVNTTIVGQGYTGYVYEILVFNSVLTTAQRQQVEGYLAHKWKLTSSVATAHPFKRFPSLTTTFAPAQLSGLSLWLDAADSGSLTLSGSSVITWRDKSGNGGHATQSTSGNRPTFTGSGVVFNRASSQWLQLNTAFASTHSIYIVATPSSASSVHIFGRAHPTSGPNIIINYVGTSLEYYPAGDGSTRSTYGSPTSTFIASYVRTYGSSVVGRFNGAQVFSVGGPTSEPSSIAWGALGQGGDLANYYTGTIYEFMIFNTALTTAQCQQVEGYLAWKWGLVGNLPSTHPYKKFTP